MSNSQTGAKRKPLEREMHLPQIAEMHLRGMTSREIAVQMSERLPYSLSHKTILADLKKLNERWQSQAMDSIVLAKAKELQRLANVERAAWNEFEASKKPAMKRMHETAGAIETVRVTEETRCGDPRYLQVIGTCIAQRSKILGLEEAHLLLRLEQLEAAL